MIMAPAVDHVKLERKDEECATAGVRSAEASRSDSLG
jgi:hypothetical protein